MPPRTHLQLPLLPYLQVSINETKKRRPSPPPRLPKPQLQRLQSHLPRAEIKHTPLQRRDFAGLMGLTGGFERDSSLFQNLAKDTHDKNNVHDSSKKQHSFGGQGGRARGRDKYAQDWDPTVLVGGWSTDVPHRTHAGQMTRQPRGQMIRKEDLKDSQGI